MSYLSVRKFINIIKRTCIILLMTKPVKLLISLGISFAAGAIGSLATTPNIPNWYQTLDKPAFNPPNWVFGPVWTLLYILMGIALYLVWTSPIKQKQTKLIQYAWFGVQLILNALWSIVFFGWHFTGLGIVIIFALLASILVTARLFWPISHTAAYLLAPYVAWVSFASTLNIAIAALN